MFRRSHNRFFSVSVGFLAAGLAWASLSSAQPAAPEGWPCVQRYQPTVSAGTFWPRELPDNVNWSETPEVKAVRMLADRVTERSVTLEQAREKIRAFLEMPHQDLQETAHLLVTALYELINGKRDRIVEGIARFSARQQMMVRRMETQAQKIGILRANNDPADAEALEDLDARQKWDVRVFEEREGMKDHLCEQPVLMEQKFFAVGRDITAYLEQRGGVSP